jgi:hypothetical protein
VAGRSTAVWEWDTREIDRFIVALESTHLLRNTPYNLAEAPKYEPRWINFFGRPIKTLFKRRKIDWEWNSKRLRKEFGASWLHIGWEILNNFMPIMLFIIAWQFFQRALKESEGKK